MINEFLNNSNINCDLQDERSHSIAAIGLFSVIIGSRFTQIPIQTISWSTFNQCRLESYLMKTWGKKKGDSSAEIQQKELGIVYQTLD